MPLHLLTHCSLTHPLFRWIHQSSRPRCFPYNLVSYSTIRQPRYISRIWNNVHRGTRFPTSNWYHTRSLVPSGAGTFECLSGLILSCSPQSTGANDILSHLRSLDSPLDQGYQDPLLILLLTPTFSTLLLDRDAFIKSAVEEVFEKTLTAIDDVHLKQTFHVLAAVVDSLPGAASPSSDKLNDSHSDSEPTCRLHSSVSQGYMGVAYSILPLDSLISSSKDEKEKGLSSQTQCSSVSFRFLVQAGTYPRSEPGDKDRSDGSNTILYEVQVPLANTIFQTGKEAAMFLTTWTKDPSTGIRRSHERDLTSVTVQYPFLLSRNPTFAASLVPLTAPRVIRTGMGNIVRTLAENDSHAQPMPASKELEEAVARFFRDRRLQPQQLSVWALIVPSVIQSQVSLRGPQNVNGKISPGPTEEDPDAYCWYLLRQGARLHRVLGGGGGWGKKAGLLSLDPSSSYAIESLNESSGMAFADESWYEDEIQALKNVTTTGDIIQFFTTLADHGTTTDVETNITDSESRRTDSGSMKVDFGVVPSSIDSPFRISPTELNHIEQKNVVFLPGRFGAFSERGLGLHISRGYPENEESKTTQTKVDVPFARFSMDH